MCSAERHARAYTERSRAGISHQDPAAAAQATLAGRQHTGALRRDPTGQYFQGKLWQMKVEPECLGWGSGGWLEVLAPKNVFPIRYRRSPIVDIERLFAGKPAPTVAQVHVIGTVGAGLPAHHR